MITLPNLVLGSPFARYQRVVVTFPSTPDTDVVVPHSLNLNDPESVEYIVLKASKAGVVYNDQSATRKAWQQGYVVLRSNVASLVATILLTVPRNV